MRDTRYEIGSALILAMVLTSLLAILGVMFVLVSRVDRISTSAISENKELSLAVETIVAKISQELVLDVPHNDPCRLRQEYYDYPDVSNAWLASLEPELIDDQGTPDPNDDIYIWRKISDVTGFLAYKGFGSQNVAVELPVPQRPKPSENFIREYPEIKVDGNGNFLNKDGSLATEGLWADADGDGVADSRWIELPNMTSKGRAIYAAVRVIDNSGMLNVNTGYKFQPYPDLGQPYGRHRGRIDGSSQMQINLMALAGRPPIPLTQAEEDALLYARDPLSLGAYEPNVVWRYDRPKGAYTPFDISDELELRNRFLLNLLSIDSRIEHMWANAFENPNLRTPVAVASALADWFYRAQHDVPGPSDIYSYRHIATTYNMDRIIKPDGAKMLNVNRADVGSIYAAIKAADPGYFTDALAAQMAVNIKDFSDEWSRRENSNVSTITVSGNTYYGFEQPCIFISELAHLFQWDDVNDPNRTDAATNLHRSYAIELRKLYSHTNTDTWQLIIDNPVSPDPLPIDLNTDNIGNFARDRRRYRVIVFEDSDASLASWVKFSDSPDDGETGVDPDVELRWDPIVLPDPNGSWPPASSYDVYFGTDQNDVNDANNNTDLWPVGTSVYKDAQYVYDPNTNTYMYDPNGSGPMDPNTTYYWRIDGLDDSNNVISPGETWSFTTWVEEPNVVFQEIHPGEIIFEPGSTITLQRQVQGTWVVVDSVPVPVNWLVADANAGGNARSFQRDMTEQRWIKRLWDNGFNFINSPTLGHRNLFERDDLIEPYKIQTHLRNRPLTNIGEVGMVFREDVYRRSWDELDTDADVRIDLTQPYIQQLFRYLTVFDPSIDGINNDGDGQTDEFNLNQTPEFEIPGRININTAPWYVIAQLPWVSARNAPSYELARAIVAYRDKLDLSSQGGPDYRNQTRTAATVSPISLREDLGFASIGELNNVVAGNDEYRIDYYGPPAGVGAGAGDQRGFPDLTTSRRTRFDGVADDFEERDLIFARISNLVTVRSDVFTAYILVRIGVDGPQKRVIAILDRSDVYPAGVGVGGIIGDVKVRALHPVPDPR